MAFVLVSLDSSYGPISAQPESRVSSLTILHHLAHVRHVMRQQGNDARIGQ